MVDESSEEIKKPHIDQQSSLRPMTSAYGNEKIVFDQFYGKQMGKRACLGETRTNNGIPSSHLRQGTTSNMYDHSNMISQSSMSTMITLTSSAESGEYTSRDSLGEAESSS